MPDAPKTGNEKLRPAFIERDWLHTVREYLDMWQTSVACDMGTGMPRGGP